MDAIATAARVIHVVLLGIWMGAAALWLSLEPGLGAVVSSRQEVYAVLGLGLERIDLFAFAAGPLALITGILGWAAQGSIGLRSAGAALLTGSAIFGSQYLTPRLIALEVRLGPLFERLDPADAQLAEHAQLMMAAQGLVILEALLAFLLIVAAVRSGQPRRRYGIEV